jgi:hypothetical protein
VCWLWCSGLLVSAERGPIIDKNLARDVLRTTFQSNAVLQDLLPALKAGCGKEEYRTYAKAIAAVIAESGLQIMNRIFAEHPELEAEVDAAITKAGRY